MSIPVTFETPYGTINVEVNNIFKERHEQVAEAICLSDKEYTDRNFASCKSEAEGKAYILNLCNFYTTYLDFQTVTAIALRLSRRLQGFWPPKVDPTSNYDVVLVAKADIPRLRVIIALDAFQRKGKQIDYKTVT